MKKLLLLFLFSIALSASSLNALPPPTKSTFVETNQAKLFCQVMGKGTPIIVLHGGPGLSQEYLLPQMNKLAEDHLVIFYDQRGCGRSENGNEPENINVSVFVEDLEAIRKEFGLKKVSILGHSWGGFLAMQYAMSHPEAIDKLILLSSLPASSKDIALFQQEWSRRMEPHMQEIEQIKASKEFIAGDPKTFANYFKIILRKYCVFSEKADELSLMASTQANLNFIKISDVFNQTLFLSSFDHEKDLKELSCKTLIVHGDQDIIPIATAETLHKNIPNSKFVIMKDCGHFPYVEKPEEMFDIINEFFQNSP